MADPISRVDAAGRAIAGLLGYNPGPGIYSRLERAIEGMPANVRVQELPGLLKRYKEGVPGWELKATDLDSTIAGRDVVPRDELLAAVRERSPVHTHGEIILGGTPQMQTVTAGPDWLTTTTRRPDYQHPDTGKVSRLGEGISHGEPRYRDYGQGGEDYAELLLHQPGPRLPDYGSHWDGDTPNAVAHARFDTHGDALRINELQSDLGIHNRKVREAAENYKGPPPQLPSEPDSHYLDRVQEQGYVMQIGDDGEWQWVNDPKKQGLPFPLEDAWTELLIKRLALEAARKGHRAIEVASPRAIADKVGGNIDNYEHFYGKVVPGAIERLGRKMGGLVEDSPPAAAPGYNALAEKIAETFPAGLNENDNLIDAVSHIVRDSLGPGNALRHAVQGLEYAYWMHPGDVGGNADFLYSQIQRALVSRGESAEDAARLASAQMPRILRMAEDNAKRRAAYTKLRALGEDQEQLPKFRQYRAINPGRRYIMSDEMRRRLIEQGVGASLLAPLLMQGEE